MIEIFSRFFSIVFIIGLLATYFLPTIVAVSRHHHQARAIFLLNLLVVWTMLGWIGMLVWSFMAIQRPVLTVNYAGKSTRAEIDQFVRDARDTSRPRTVV